VSIGHPRLTIASLLLAVHLVGCSEGPASPPSPSPPILAGTAWRLVSIAGRTVPVGAEATLAFTPTDVSGNGGCNRFNGGYAHDPQTGSVRIGALASTKRACLERGRTDLENAFFAALRDVDAASLDPAGRLVLSGAGSELVLERSSGLG
jgi:heat shock protein HslJ